MNFTPIAFMEHQVDLLLANYVNSTSAHLSAALGAAALAGLTIYYLMLGLSFARGEVSEPLARLLKDALGQLLICIVVLGGAYQGTVVDFFHSLQAEMVSGVTDHRASTVGQTLDLFFSDFNIQVDGREVPMSTVMLDLSITRHNTIGLPDFTYLAGATMVALSFVIVATLCLLPAILSKIGLALMLAIGPVFVMLLLWPATRSYFNSWLSATLSFVFTTVLVTMVCTVTSMAFIETMKKAMTGVGGDRFNPVSIGIAMLIASIGLGFTALHVSQKGAQLAGGGIAMDGKGVMGTLIQTLVLGMRGGAGKGGAGQSPNSISQAAGGSPAATAGPAAGPASRVTSIVAGLDHRNR